MKILFLDAYFFPEQIAFTHIEQDIMEGLVNAGHQIRVVCPTPTRGVTGETIKKYKRIKHETLNGVEIFRFWAPCEGRNPFIRAFRYFWCHFRGNMIAKRHKDVDAMFAVSTPPTQGYFASKAAAKLGVPLVFSLQDLFPDSLVTTGLTREGSLLYKIGARIEKKTYARSARIIPLCETVRRSLLKKGVPEDKLITVNNWIDTDAVQPIKREDNRLFEEFGIDRDRFVVVYAGNFGASQGADVILRAASLLSDRQGITFMIFGGGTEFEKAQEIVQKERLTNVSMHPLLPAQRVSEVYSMGDVALITCKTGVGKTAVPSKLWSIMACNTPIIASFDTDSELADILKEARGGVCVEPEDPAALAAAIDRAYQARSSVDFCSEAREYVIRCASKQTCVEKYVHTIENCAETDAADSR